MDELNRSIRLGVMSMMMMMMVILVLTRFYKTSRERDVSRYKKQIRSLTTSSPLLS